MNIFYLDSNPQKCAVYHCDKHVVKMIVEYTQILSTTHRLIDGEYIEAEKVYKLPDERESMLYKATHINHPSVLWARTSVQGYKYTHTLLTYLLEEYKIRYNKTHKCNELLETLRYLPGNIINLDDVVLFKKPPLVMPEQYHNENVVKAYRDFYMGEKASFAKWKTGNVPYWWFKNKKVKTIPHLKF